MARKKGQKIIKRNANDKYKRYKEVYFHSRIFSVLPIMAFLCIFIDITALYRHVPLWHGLRVFLGRLLPDDLSANADTFFAVWGVAIALAIFLVEISGSYHCGIRLKRITRWHWGIRQICLGAVEYLLLGPLMYFSNAFLWKVTSFWCVIVSFAGMGYMLVFFQCYMHIDVIQELVIDKTIQKIRLWKKKKQKATHSRIDELPMTEMLEYVDYKQAYELQVMSDTLSSVMGRSRGVTLNTMLENTLFLTWVKHIVLHSGIADETEKEFTLSLLSTLWKQITQKCEEREDGQKKSRQKNSEQQKYLTYAIQMLIPFIDIGGEDANDMLIRVWKILNLYSQVSLIYLLLYTEFRYWFVDGKVHEWLRTDDQTMRYEFEKIRRGKFGWQKETAWQYWLDWSQYSRLRGDIGMKQFENFSRNVEALKRGRTEQMRISVLSCI